MAEGRTAQAGLAAIATLLVILGFLVPLSFVSRLDSFGMYVQPAELPAIFGTIWLQHLPVAIIAALIIFALALPFARSRLSRGLPAAIMVGGFVAAALLALRPLVPGLISAHLAIVAIFAAALWAALRKPGMAGQGAPVARMLALAGIPFAVFALVQGYALNRRVAPVPQQGTIADQRPDILLVTLDAFANGHMSDEGYPRDTTPRIDAFAKGGTRFSRLFANSNFTTPTINSLLSGQRPWRHSANQQGSRPRAEALSGSLPARLHAAGYSLRSVSTNPWAGVYKNGYGRWFDHVPPDNIGSFSACRNDLSRWLPHSCAAADAGIVRLLAIQLERVVEASGFRPQGHHNHAAPALANAERLFHRGADGRPIFLWVHVLPPHDPYIAPAPWLGRVDPSALMRSTTQAQPPYGPGVSISAAQLHLFQARYDEMLMAADAQVGAFLDKLLREKRLDRTIVAITADHGESFQAGYTGHGGPGLHLGLTNIPFILRGPGVPQGKSINAPVEQSDIAPTLLQLAGQSAGANTMDGQSLVAIMSGADRAGAIFTMNLESASRFSEPASGSAAIVDGAFALVHRWGHAASLMPAEGLYRYGTDPNMLTDVSAADPARASAMRASLLAERAKAITN